MTKCGGVAKDKVPKDAKRASPEGKPFDSEWVLSRNSAS